MGDTAIVTGASSGIGFEISKTLCRLGYEVFGIGRTFNAELVDSKFHKVICDLLDTEKLCDTVKEISSQNRVTVLVNNAGTAYYGLHEELNAKKIQQMVRTNLEAPMILTCQLLRELKRNKGYVINISSVTANGSNPHGCAYGATKAGLSSFSHSLFDEARKYGIKVVTISPDMTQTNLYRNADFQEGDEADSYLMPEEVAGAVEYALSQRQGLVVSDITLKPQLHRIKRK
ncbi:MAG: SDR family oxidoreductase [Lachnospiraceae bacterium]|nr:SDR family oxidoreductase [Lachnospiraceae bacterium]